MTGIGKGDAYQSYFNDYSALELKQLISSNQIKSEFCDAAMQALSKVGNVYEKTQNDSCKIDFINLASKFVQVFPDEKEKIDELNKVAHDVFGIATSIQKAATEDPQYLQHLEQCKEIIRQAHSDRDIRMAIFSGTKKEMVLSAGIEIAKEYLRDPNLNRYQLQNKLESLMAKLEGISGIDNYDELNNLALIMNSNQDIFVGTKLPQMEELRNLAAALEFSKDMPFAAFLHDIVTSEFKSHFDELSANLLRQLSKVPILEHEVLATSQHLVFAASKANVTISEKIQEEVSKILTRSLNRQDGSNALKLALDGKFAELSLEEIGRIPAVLDNLSKYFPDSPQISRAQLSDAVFKYVSINQDEMKNNPELATRAHDILHDLAQREMAEGNYQSAFAIEGNAAALFPLPATHPLHEMDKAILAGTAKQVNPKTGANFSSMDSTIVKGGNLHATQRTIDGELRNCFDFKVSHYARDELQVYLQNVGTHLDEFKASLPPGLCTDVHFRNVFHQFVKFNGTDYSHYGAYNPCNSYALELYFEGAGKITIGNDGENGTMVNSIQVEMDANLPPGEGAKKLQQILAVAGLGPVLGKQPPEADERMKILQLFRAYYPSSCTSLDTKKQIFRLSIEEVKREILMIEPGMEAIFKKYLETNPELMEKVSIMPGKEIWGVKDLGQLMKAKGAWGLMTGVGNSGGWYSAKEAVVRILTQGAMSSEQRFQTGVFKEGQSSEDDFSSGGGDQVFTRLINQHTSANDIRESGLHGHAQILWNLDTLAPRVPYGYDEDRFGIKNRFTTELDSHDNSYEDYQRRLSPVDLAETVTDPNNEMMFKNAIDPSHVMGVVVQSSSAKADLIEHLKTNGLAEEDAQGVVNITFAGKRIKAEDFIHVGYYYSKEWWG